MKHNTQGFLMECFSYRTLDVFTGRAFGGNQLAVFTDARGLSDQEMQALAAEMNFSETTFVLPPDDDRHDARVRIFHRTAEMPFAGHPNVGTAYILGQALPGTKDRLLFEEMAGLVEARLLRAEGAVIGAEIDAPQPLQVHQEIAPEGVATCVSLQPDDLVTSRHLPVRASVGVDFVLAEVAPESLSRAAPDRSAFERLAVSQPGPDPSRCSILIYSRAEAGPLRARMFAPLAGTWEDPATGSAQAALAAFLLSLDDTQESSSYDAVQGIEMGRPSALKLRAWRSQGKVRASVGGKCMPMFRGEYRR